MHHLKNYKFFNEARTLDKLYYHGRSSQRGAYRGTYIYLTDSLEYAAGYAEGRKEVYSYKLLFPETRIFSILNPLHLAKVSRLVQRESIKNILQASVDDNGKRTEMDWASFGNLFSDDYEEPEDLLQHLGYKAVKLKERPYANSVLVFDEKNTMFIDMVDLRTPDTIKQLSDWENYITSTWNHL